MEQSVVGKRFEPRRSIKFEHELSHTFGDQIAAMPGCEKLDSCIQCGTCSATCPLSIYMDYTPRRIVAMTRAGFKDEVLRCFTIWLCASCYACTVDCPKQIKITDIMYSLKQRAIEEKVYPKGFMIPALAHSFFETIMRFGRSTESLLITKMYLKTNPLKMFKQMGVGLALFRTGRMGIIPDRIQGPTAERHSLPKLMAAVDRLQKGGPRLAAAKEAS